MLLNILNYCSQYLYTISFSGAPLVENFTVKKVKYMTASLAWLENKLYVVHELSKEVRVFEGQAPYNEIPEAIKLRKRFFMGWNRGKSDQSFAIHQ